MAKDKKTILVVEDEVPISKAITDKFRREGFEVLQAFDGEDGLEVALKKKPDLILLDILMPKVDGITMLKNLREDMWGKNVPVFLLTVLSDMDKISEAVQVGVSGYLIKSDWKLEDVVEKAKDQLSVGG
ncbi:response regulator [Candidatus Dojkabacteria bacterium]|nr:response regulator [Candidatus Dojkabacteria bacterium]